MKLAVVHHHLNPGGVTRVIANQLLALDAVVEQTTHVCILHGPGDDGWPNEAMQGLRQIQLERYTLPSLGYSTPSPADPAAVSGPILERLSSSGFDPQQTVIQVHNHALGKNASVTASVPDLAQAGFGILLQIHDFAEDSRPRNLRYLRDSLGHDQWASRMYPSGGRIHYAVLNQRDWAVMQGAGCAADRLHFVPNPIQSFDRLPDHESVRRQLHEAANVAMNRPLFLYPVRGIRRKNIGEMLLWSATLRNEATFGMTLAPLNPVEVSTYQNWKEFASRNNLPVVFEMGEQLSFTESMAAADWILTTSVAEGFGMVYLESWLAGRGLTGRNLPEITGDFVENGVVLNHVYDRIDIPIDWIDVDRYLERLRIALDQVYKSFGVEPITGAEWERIQEAKVGRGAVDFADLDEPLQRAVIERVLVDDEVCASVRKQLDSLHILPGTADEDEVDECRQRILEVYGLRPSGERLLNLLREVLATVPDEPPVDSLDADRVLQSFLDGAQLRLLRT